MTIPFILLNLVFLGLFFIMAAFAYSRYIKCPPDKLLVIYGKIEPEIEHSAKVLAGGAAFVWPVIQAYEFLSLKPVEVEIDFRTQTTDQIIIQILGSIKCRISNRDPIMYHAAERLLGKKQEEIKCHAKDIIYSELTKIFSTFDLLDIATNKEKLFRKLSHHLNLSLNKVGLELHSIHFNNLKDRHDYIKKLEEQYKQQVALSFQDEDENQNKYYQEELKSLNKQINTNAAEREKLLNQKLNLLVKTKNT